MARYLLIIFALFSGCTTECSQSTIKSCDFKLEEALVLGGAAQSWDLNHDGSDEFVVRMISGNEAGRSIHILSSTGYVMDQVNFSGSVMPILFTDYNEDQTPEILVPFVRNDSLFVSFLNSSGEKLFQFFLVDGHPRVGDDGAIAWEWDPAIRLAYFADVDGDNNNELITVVYTGYARNPRGILVNRLPDGELLGEYMIGSFPSQSFFGDFDNNGQPEVVLSTWAPDNGASVNGFDDRHSYIINVELTPEPVLKWSREMGGIGSNVFLMHADFAADVNDEFLALSYTTATRQQHTSLELIDPVNWKTILDKPINAVLREPQVIYPYADKKGHIVTIRDPGEIWRYNENFETDRSNEIAPNYHALTSLPDMDGDGVEEVVVFLPDATLYLLDGELTVKATYKGLKAVHPASTVLAQRVSLGIGEDPALMVFDGSSSYVLSLSKNKAAWLYRIWQPFAVVGFLIVAIAGYFLFSSSQPMRPDEIPPVSLNKTVVLSSRYQGFADKVEPLVLDRLADSNLSVSNIADQLGMSEYLLRKGFKDAYGMPPKQFILNKRIAMARHLFDITDKSVKEVAFEVGFQSPEHFSKQFLKITNKRPSEFKKDRTA